MALIFTASTLTAPLTSCPMLLWVSVTHCYMPLMYKLQLYVSLDLCKTNGGNMNQTSKVDIFSLIVLNVYILVFSCKMSQMFLLKQTDQHKLQKINEIKMIIHKFKFLSGGVAVCLKPFHISFCYPGYSPFHWESCFHSFRNNLVYLKQVGLYEGLILHI